MSILLCPPTARHYTPLQPGGYQVSPEKVGQLLHASGYSLQATHKTHVVDGGDTGPPGEHRACVVPLGVTKDSNGTPGSSLLMRDGHVNGSPGVDTRRKLLHEKIEPLLERELQHREVVPAGGSYAAKLIGWVEVGAA